MYLTKLKNTLTYLNISRGKSSVFSLAKFQIILILSLCLNGHSFAAGVSTNTLVNAVSKKDIKNLGDLLELDDGQIQKSNNAVKLLEAAVCTQDNNVLKYLMDHKFDINSVAIDTSGHVWDGNVNLISHSIECAHRGKINTDLIKSILAYGYKYSNDFDAPTFVAVKTHHLDSVIWLHKNGLRITGTGREYPNVAIYMAEEARTDKDFYNVLDYLLSTGEIDINAIGYGHYDSKKTLLGIATIRNDEKLVNYLVKHGAKSNVAFRYIDTGETTPLEYAISKGNIAIAKVLKSAPNNN